VPLQERSLQVGTAVVQRIGHFLVSVTFVLHAPEFEGAPCLVVITVAQLQIYPTVVVATTIVRSPLFSCWAAQAPHFPPLPRLSRSSSPQQALAAQIALRPMLS